MPRSVIQRLRQATAGGRAIHIFFQPVQNIICGRSANAQSVSICAAIARSRCAPELRAELEAALRRVPGIQDVNSDLALRRALDDGLTIDRDAAARLGLSVDQIRTTLYSAFGSRQVSTIYAPEDTYQVILEADPAYLDAQAMLRRLTGQDRSGQQRSARCGGPCHEKPAALTVSHLAQLPAVTLSFNLAPGTALSEAVDGIV